MHTLGLFSGTGGLLCQMHSQTTAYDPETSINSWFNSMAMKIKMKDEHWAGQKCYFINITNIALWLTCPSRTTISNSSKAPLRIQLRMWEVVRTYVFNISLISTLNMIDQYHLYNHLYKGSHHKKKVLFLWTLSVPPLAPPPGLRTLRGVFFLKARTSDSWRLERKNA